MNWKFWQRKPATVVSVAEIKPISPLSGARSSKNGERLTEWEENNLRDTRKCPDCGGELAYGPSGGMCVNIACADCGSEFNYSGIMGTDRISNRGKPDWNRLEVHYRIKRPDA